MTTCPICEKHQKNDPGILFENDAWVISAGPHASHVLGYVYLEPKRHVEDWTELSTEEFSQVGPLVKKVEAFLKEQGKAERLYMVTISEAVRHLHIHLIPREEGGELKGLPLIEQATQQKDRKKTISMSGYQQFLKKLQTYLN
ncbi:HIT domain-containing protein [Halobacillus litoralis]|uniref:HIT domain-containing protein n=1 Tax=Halobacillus litoralis TaxID=45668 RepID=A0A845DR78_9BACI|nr:HIT family protein [Halobacillus litoralis]MYL20121.1 HIT domain-containing protein [Halobacillus litoralis]